MTGPNVVLEWTVATADMELRGVVRNLRLSGLAGVKGHHVFVNSELGKYIDHFKGDRKNAKSSKADDIRKTPEMKEIDYWKNK